MPAGSPSGNFVAEAGPPLVVVDRALDLGAHLGELAVGLQTPPLDSGERVVADHVVRVDADRHDAISNVGVSRFGRDAGGAPSTSFPR